MDALLIKNKFEILIHHRDRTFPEAHITHYDLDPQGVGSVNLALNLSTFVPTG